MSVQLSRTVQDGRGEPVTVTVTPAAFQTGRDAGLTEMLSTLLVTCEAIESSCRFCFAVGKYPHASDCPNRE